MACVDGRTATAVPPMLPLAHTSTSIASTTPSASTATTVTISRECDGLRDGEIVTAADGYGRWRPYTVDGVDGGVVSLRATADFAHEPPLVPALTIAFALTKGERPELAVQKLTELGADEIVLVRSARSIVRWDAGARAPSGRSPPSCGTRSGRTEPAGAASGDRRAGAAGGDRRPLGPGARRSRRRSAAAELPAPPDGRWVVAVGPEGGFDDAERAVASPACRASRSVRSSCGPKPPQLPRQRRSRAAVAGCVKEIRE